MTQIQMDFKNHFRALTPNEYIDLSHYREALDHVFACSSIRNIALTGAYGSGKSSVIRSYENIHKDRTFIHISLAHFEEQGNIINTPAEKSSISSKDIISEKDGIKAEKGVPSSNSIFQHDPLKIINDLEGKIVNQLIHQIPAKHVPQSHFPVRTKESKRRHIIITIVAMVFITLLIYTLWFQKWTATVNTLNPSKIKTILLATTNPYGRLSAVLLLLLLCGLILFYLLDTHSVQFLFKKIDLKGLVGIELFDTEKDTYFDKYLNQVIYLFDQADADAIVFEDLDRYDVTLIFEKLREINDLAYSRTRQGLRPGKKPLRFFYLIRDDVFTASDRSKFFDFIIPVVPYVDTSNSCDQLLQRFEEAGLEGLFTKRFLQDVSLYLGDMRLVSNIVNEYIVYRGRLSGSGLTTKPDRQLAMVIYKNLYPGDFDLLQKGRGYVYALFEQKKQLQEKRKAQLAPRIQELRQQLEEAKSETLRSVDNLNAIYFPLSESEITIDGVDASDLSRTELVRQILEKPDAVKYTYYTKDSYYGPRYWHRNTASLDVESKRAEMKATDGYIRHKKNIETQDIQHQKEITKELQHLQETQAKLSTMNLRELLPNLEPDEEKAFWSFKLPPYEPKDYLAKIKNSKNFSLLKYLVRNGYIDENYAAYVSYFYPNSLTAQDRNFLLSIADRAPLAYDYHLDRPDAILDRLEQADFSLREVRNFDLLVYLLKIESPNLHTFLQSGKSDDSAHLFFAEFWRTGRKYTRSFRFICALYQERPEWFRMWCETTWILLEGEWRTFILDALYFLSSDRIKRINSENWLTRKISADPEFLQQDHPNTRRLIPALKALDIQFSRLDYRNKDIPLVREICRENLYTLNLSMLKTAMAVFWNVPPTEVERRSYSYIFLHPDEPLSLRVLGEMDVYADAILHESTTRFSDDEVAVIDFLNCETLSESYKEEYIQRLDTVLEDINAVTLCTLWPTLIESQCVAYTWQNMADYFAKSGKDTDSLPSELSAFINSGSGPLGWDYAQLNQRVDECADKLRQAVLISGDLSLERYQAALVGMTFSYQKGFPFHDIPDERMKIILELGIAPVTVENIEVIRDYYPQLWNNFILPKGAEDLIELMDTSEIQLEETELASLLEDSQMDNGIAEKILFIFSKTVSLRARAFSNTVRARIVEAHLDPKDIPLLLKSFAQESPKVQSAFLSYTGKHADMVADAAENDQFIPSKVYAACLNVLTEDRLLALRPYLENRDFEIVCTENKKPKFPDTLEVRDILNAFKSYHWISSWNIRNGKIIAFPTRK